MSFLVLLAQIFPLEMTSGANMCETSIPADVLTYIDLKLGLLETSSQMIKIPLKYT